MRGKIRYECLLKVHLILCYCIISISSYSQSNETSSYQLLKSGFENPPTSAHPKVYWWWLNGNVDSLRLKEEMLAMKSAGISGFDIFEIGVPESDKMIAPGPAFMSDESLLAIKLVVDMAGELGMEAGLNMASSWNAGGSWIRPEHSSKSLYYSKISVSGKTAHKLKIPFPEISPTDKRGRPKMISFSRNGKPDYYEDVAVLAYPVGLGKNNMDTSKIINITSYFDTQSEVLNWQAPEGNWEIMRFVCSNSGEQLRIPSKNSAGSILDHFDANATEMHFMHIINALTEVLGNLKETALKSLYLASYEATEFAWTSKLPAEFNKINGYDVYKFLPGLYDKEFFNEKLNSKFNTDLAKTLSFLMINNFYAKAKEISNRYGLKINSEAGGPGPPLHNVPTEHLEALGTLDLPRGEFWINHSRYNDDGIDILRVVKEVSAASHIYGKGIVEEEAFTTFQHWQEGPFDMKSIGDRAFCEGMNRVVVHGFSHNPQGTGSPGYVYHAGTHYNDKRVWWKMVKPFNQYLSRMSYILQEADFFADVLYYYGDELPNYVAPKNNAFAVAPGYDYEVINSDILGNLEVEDGKIVLPTGQKFSLLVIGGEEVKVPHLLVKIKQLSKKGAIITGDAQLNLKSKKNNYYGTTPSKILAAENIVPDFSYVGDEFSTLDYIHYSKNDIDFYLVRNTTDDWISRKCNFRQQNKIPQIWNPETGEVKNVNIYNEKDRSIQVPITLAPYGSYFVVFKRGKERLHYNEVSSIGLHPPRLQFTNNGIHFLDNGTFELKRGFEIKKVLSTRKFQNLSGAWEVFFPEGWGAPERVIFPELTSWTKHENQGIKYYSGIARYKKTFLIDPVMLHQKDFRKYLSLGDLSKVGEVWLNGQPLGVAWAKPYSFDITGLLKPGDNTIEVEIANTWSNRLTGDAINSEKFTNTNVTFTDIDGLNKIDVPWADAPLLESGLLGPVTIEIVKLFDQ